MSSSFSSYIMLGFQLRKRNKSNCLERLNTMANIKNECARYNFLDFITDANFKGSFSDASTTFSLNLGKVPLAIRRDCVSRKDIKLMVVFYLLLHFDLLYVSTGNFSREFLLSGWIGHCQKLISTPKSSLENYHSCFLNIESLSIAIQ